MENKEENETTSLFEEEEEKEEEKIKNTEIDLKEYIIYSKYFPTDNIDDDNDNDNDSCNDSISREIFLPTPESFKKFCEHSLVKDLLTFNYEKYKNFFQKNNDNENIVLNLNKIPSINDPIVLAFVICFIGGINSETSINNFSDFNVLTETKHYIEYHINYFDYLNSVIDYLKKEKEYTHFSINSLNILLKSLDELGICIPKDKKNILYSMIRDFFLSLEKILILIAPSQNFWIKSEKNIINQTNYDKKLNNHTNIFYNHKFIKNFFSIISKYPRCEFGLLCSMKKQNLQNCWEGLKIFSNINYKLDPIFIDQESHEIDPEQPKNNFLRSMKKIIEYLKKRKNTNFNESNIIILESEKKKMVDTEKNSILVNLFSEKYIEDNVEQRASLDNKGNEVVNYIKDLLENCTDDIRNYIKNNEFKN